MKLSIFLSLFVSLNISLEGRGDEPGSSAQIVSGTVPDSTPMHVGSTGLSAMELEYWESRSKEVLGSNELRAKLASELESRYPNSDGPEAIKMLKAIANDSMMGSHEGWFGPANSLYDWQWLSTRYQPADSERISKSEFSDADSYFFVLDRDGNGSITQEDLNWSADSEWVKRASTVNQLFRSIDAEGDNRVNRDELISFFDRLRGKADAISSQDLRDFMLRGRESYVEGDAPTPDKLLNGLFNNEIGSLHQGPGVGDTAPDFSLNTVDGSQRITLSELVGDRPIVLVFGNFTCGPFRRNLPEVEDVHQRYSNQAIFLGIYVREAHPTNGWVMASNTNKGVHFAQPLTYDERVAIASKCQTTLNYKMPLLVDTIDDEVGNLYSGMPARLYVIDKTGKITYKAGRGPYGFKVGEMEQALVLTLLDGIPK